MESETIGKILALIPPGTCVHIRIKNTIGEVAFLIKDYPEYLPRAKEITFVNRFLIMDTSKVTAGILLSSIPETGSTYETYFNHCATPNILEGLAQMDTLFYVFYDPNGKLYRKIGTPNKFKKDFQKLLDVSKSKSPWSMEEFDNLKMEIQGTYTLEQLKKINNDLN